MPSIIIPIQHSLLEILNSKEKGSTYKLLELTSEFGNILM